MAEARPVTFLVDVNRALTQQVQIQCSLEVAAEALILVAVYEVSHCGLTDGSESSL